MEIVLSSIITNGRLPTKARRNGREFLTVPAISIVEGVLAGSDGPIFYPGEEISKSPGTWDGMPLTVYHPYLNGVPVSAKHPEILNRQWIGDVQDTKSITDNNNLSKLSHKLWFDVEHTRKKDRRILNALNAGKRIELSTGLFLDRQIATNNAVHNGKPYTHIARNFRPDHIAILPDVKGACSIDDGCGVGIDVITNALTVINEMKMDKKCPHCGKEYGPGDVKDGKCPHCDKAVSYTSNILASSLTELAANGDFFKDDIIQRVVNQVTNQPEWQLTRIIPTDSPLHPQHPDNINSGIIAFNQSQYKEEDGIPPSVSQGEIKPSTTNESNDGSPNPDKTDNTTQTTEVTMAAMTKEEKDGHISYLITNCKCWEESDRNTLNSLPDAKVLQLRQAAEEDKTKQINNQNTPPPPPYNPTPPVPAATVPPPPPPPRFETNQAWMDAMPPEARAIWNRAVESDKKEREHLCTILVQNIRDENYRKAMWEDFLKKDTDELRKLASILPPPPQHQQTYNQNNPPFYGGAFPPAPDYRQSEAELNDILPLPTDNWADVLEHQRKVDREKERAVSG